MRSTWRPGARVRLRAPRAALDGVRIAGLGEATHGTREFFRLKHVLLRYLVEELGFTVLAMEASVSASAAVDDYVMGRTDDPAGPPLSLGFWIVNTHEVLAVLEWLREHNRTVPAPARVRFAGIDPQYAGASLRWLRANVPGHTALLGRLAPRRSPRRSWPGWPGHNSGFLRADVDSGPSAPTSAAKRTTSREEDRPWACP